MTAPNEATQRQIEAADPKSSTWVAANAGSGKTRVLTDRVARLLLEGVAPENILCLTYTKAAATEMQNRLFQRLGAWSMMPNDRLKSELLGLGLVSASDAALFANARRLFAKAIETPGGLKIQTIHSFCASLLRRFPLEAGVSPQFVEMEERTAKLLRAEVVEDIAKGENQAVFDALARYHSGDDLDALTQEIMSNKDALSTLSKDGIFTALDLDSTVSLETVVHTLFARIDRDWWAKAIGMLSDGSVASKKMADAMSLIDLNGQTTEDFSKLCKIFLNSDGTSKSHNFPPSSQVNVRAKIEPILPELHDFMDRVFDVRQVELTLNLAHRSCALMDFAKLFIPTYEARKLSKAWLDFDDLILKARALLTQSAVAQWVLFRLDGGIDHILVDEAQDTSPAQWDVIENLAREFTTGASARSDVQRTIFVVGDPKQSIYSFQGADPAGFERMKDFFAENLQRINQPFKSLDLAFSFRSSPAILDIVDATFDDLADDFPQRLKHRAFKSNLPGRVDLWPLVEKTPKASDTPWSDPLDRLAETDHTVVLARTIASSIREMLDGDTAIPVGEGAFKKIQPKDILVLVQRRGTLFNQIIQACKSEGLPIAGADRLKIGGELAVKDIAAVLSFLATPEDSLSLASALRSPLLGWSEQDLFTAAHARETPFLWAHLRGLDTVYPKTLAILNDLRAQADFMRPYDLIERLLTRHSGRAALLARLGTEAEDGIDALLDQALAYERTQVPSLTGFLIWLDSDDVEIKRQVDSASNQMRVMTVHGSKGLEAPIVFLPDSANRVLRHRKEIVATESAALWKPVTADQPERLKSELDADKLKEERERLRLLYVAMTRAEKWLIVAAAGDLGKNGDSWYHRVEKGLDAAGAHLHDFENGQGKRYEFGTWEQANTAFTEIPSAQTDLDAFFGEPVGQVAEVPTPLTASSLPGAKALPSALGQENEEDAKLLGTKVHLLLEHQPDFSKPVQIDILLGSDQPEMNKGAIEIAKAVLDDPKLAFIFDPNGLNEVNLTANMPSLDGQRLRGTVDRLLVGPDEVLAVDYKTNMAVPTRAEDVPIGILRQMGAYYEALAQIFPNHQIKTGILWTTTREFMGLGDEIVRNALKSTTAS